MFHEDLPHSDLGFLDGRAGTGRLERTSQAKGVFLLLLAEMHVSRTESKSGFRPDRGGTLDFDDAEPVCSVLDHVLQNQQLLVVLLAEEAMSRFGQFQQTAHDEAHATEEVRSDRIFESRACGNIRKFESLCRRGRIFQTLRIDLIRIRCEEQVCARVLRHLAVSSEISRVVVEILMRGELSGIHEDAHQDRSADGGGFSDQ